jgi:arylsulfatase A
MRLHISLMALLAVSAIGTGCSNSSKKSTDKPNIVLIFADDLGYGDVGCYNPESRIPTPNIDKLAKQGIRFTDAHSADSVCTPSRYGLLTGRYSWRGKLKTGVLFNWEPPLIEQGRPTIASLLKKNGYRTAISGKWHLGLGFTAKEGKQVDFNKPLPWPSGPEPDRSISESIDFSVPMFGGPETLGFDETYYTAGCSTDQEPFCFIENGIMQNMEAANYRNPYGSWRSGMAAPDWVNETVDISFTEWALQFIDRSHKDNLKQPFFLYLPLSSPHSPHVTADFALGKSEAGTRGDMVWLVDWATGQIADKLDELGITENTLLIVTSDNGPLLGSLKVGETEGMARITNAHKSMGELRGRKGRVWEGGHRVPFVARWPDNIRAGSVSNNTMVFTDMLATFADLLNVELPKGAAEDSFTMLPALLGQSMDPRPAIIHHSNSAYAMRSGNWKIVFGQGEERVQPEEGKGYLFDLETDPYETNDLWKKYPEIVAKLTEEFDSIRKLGIYSNL